MFTIISFLYLHQVIFPYIQYTFIHVIPAIFGDLSDLWGGYKYLLFTLNAP